MAAASHIKSTFKHALIYSSAGIIGKAIGFIMLPIYSHHLQAEGYGVIGMIDTVLSVMTLLIGYGISGAMSRFYYETNDTEQRRKIVSTTILLMFALVLIVTSPALLFSKQVAWLAFGRSDWQSYITLAVLAFMATMTAKNAENYIYILQRSLFMSSIALCRLVISLSLNIYFIVYLRLGVLGYLYASLIDGVLYSVFMHVIALRSVGLSFDRAIARNVLGFSLPLLPGYVAMFVRNNADRVLLRTFMGLSQVGVFEVLFKFATLIGFFVVEPFSKIWSVKRFEVCEQEDGPQILAQTYTYYLAILLFLGLILSLEIPLVIRLLTPETFWISGFVVYFAVISRILLASYYHLFFGLMYAKKTFKVSQIQMLTAVISLAMTIPLVWQFGLMGAVLAATASALIQCVLGYRMARPYYYVPFQWSNIVKMAMLMTALYILAKDFTVSGSPLELFANRHVVPLIDSLGQLLYLDHVKNGKLMAYLTGRLPTVIDGILMLLYSCLFIIGLILLKIIPSDKVKILFSIRKLKNPKKLFGSAG